MVTHTTLTGSGTLEHEHSSTKLVAVSKETLCPTDTYTGLVALSEVKTAYTNKCHITFNESLCHDDLT